MRCHSVLVACTPAAISAARQALGDDMAISFVHSVATAIPLIPTGRFSIVVGTLQFDESRLFELLPAAKASGTPIIATKLTVSSLSRNVVEHSFRAAMLSGFDACLDLESLLNSVGRHKAHEQFRATVMNIAMRVGR